MVRILVVSFAVATFLLTPAALFGLVKPPAGAVLPDFDIRSVPGLAGNAAAGGEASSAKKPLGIHHAAAGSASARAALDRLGTPEGGKPRATWNPLNGSARFLRSPRGPLTGPGAGDPAEIARRFLTEYGGLFGLRKGDVVGLGLAYRYKSANNGVTHLFFQQQLDGVDVFQGYVQLNIAGDGSIVTAACGDTASPTGVRTRFVLSAAEAVRRTASAVGMEPFEPVRINSAAEKIALFARGPMLSSIPAEPVFFPMRDGARAAFRIGLQPPGYPAYYEVLIDAESGALLLRRNLTKYVETQGLVFRENPDVAPQALVPFPDDAVFIDPSSPAGWVFTNESRGNNVDAKEDHAGDDESTIGQRSIAAGTPLTFGDVFTNIWQTSGGTVLGDTAAADTNVFYWANFLHDRTYKLGFTEAAGNFQVDNFGLAGLQNDPVLADIQDAYDLGQRNNAFSTPLPDGQAGRASFFLFDNPRFADSDFDGDIVFHELTHLVSSRLVGGPGGLAQCLGGLPQSGAIGEGTSDFVPASIFSDPVMGEYSTGDPVNGIRRHPLDGNAYTYGDLCTINPFGCEVHDDGEIWGETLWKMRAAILAVAGSPDGIEISEQLLIDGMKFSPCFPSFLDLRDAILAADFVDYDGAYHCTIWQAFASSGMGFSATSDPDDQSIVTEAFDLPAECTGTGAIRFNRDSYNCGTEGFVILVDSNASVPVPVQVVTSSGDAETFEISSGGGRHVSNGPVPHHGGIVTRRDRHGKRPAGGDRGGYPHGDLQRQRPLREHGGSDRDCLLRRRRADRPVLLHRQQLRKRRRYGGRLPGSAGIPRRRGAGGARGRDRQPDSL